MSKDPKAKLHLTEEYCNRIKWVRHQDPLFLQWVVTKYARSVYLSIPCCSKRTIICVYEKYKSQLKNVGKRAFDICGIQNEAKLNFIHWLVNNDIDSFINKSMIDLKEEYCSHKRALYQRYKNKNKLGKKPDNKQSKASKMKKKSKNSKDFTKKAKSTPPKKTGKHDMNYARNSVYTIPVLK